MRRRDERARLPLRKSLLGRLLTVSALVASCSVAATAWIAVQTTSGAIRQEQGQNLTADAKIYNTLLGYAATHPGWEGVDDTVRKLAQQSQRRIALTTQDRRPLFDSSVASPAPRPSRHSRRRPRRSSTRCPSTPRWCPTPPPPARTASIHGPSGRSCCPRRNVRRCGRPPPRV